MGKKSKKKRKAITQTPASKPLKIAALEKHPDWTAFGILFLLLMIFFSPVMLSNKTLLPPDTIASKSFEPFVEDALSRGVYPLWNPYIFGGMPSFASLSRAPYVEIVGTVIAGAIWLVQRVIPLTDFTRFFVNYLLLGGMVYLLLRSKKLSVGAALFASVAMIFIPQVVAYSAFGHSTKLGTAVFIPLIFLLVDRLLERRNLLYFSLLGLAVGLQLLRAHVQICFYTYLMIGIFFIAWSVGEFRDNKRIGKIVQGGGLIVGAVLFGVIVSSVLNLSVWEYSHYSIRGGGVAGGLDYGYATNWSFSPAEITTFFIPSFMGFGGGTYWGPMPFTDFPQYFGIVTFFLAGLALLVNRNRMTWFFAILAIFTLFVSFGKHFPVLYGPMFKFFPLFNKFRAPNMIHIVFEFSMVILAAYGLQAVMEFKEDPKQILLKKIKKYATVFSGVVLVLFLILLLGKGSYMGWASRIGEPAAAYDNAVGDGAKALVLTFLSAAVVLAAIRKKLNVRWLPVVLMVLLVVDLWSVDRRFVKPRPAAEEKAYFTETEDVRFLKQREGLFRIWPVENPRSPNQRGPNWYMYHKIQNVLGYQGAKLRVYQELMNAFEPFLLSSQNPSVRKAFFQLMNVRYGVSAFNLTGLDSTFVPVVMPKRAGDRGVFEFTNFLPRVFFPQEVTPVQGSEAILQYMTNGSWDPARTAIMEERPPVQIEFSDQNNARIVDYDIQRIVIEAEVKTRGLMVLSEMYYPAGWKVFVDGQEGKIYKTDYVLRSVFLEPGAHRVEFVFQSKMFQTGLVLSLSSFLLLTAGAVVGWQRERRKRSQIQE